MTSGRRSLALASFATLVACAEPTAVPERTAGPEVGDWATWVLPRGDALRPASPAGPSSSITKAEVVEIERLQRDRTAATDSIIREWDGDPSVAWSRLAIDRLDYYWPLLPVVRIATPVRAGRIMALLQVALHDAMIAVWDAKYAYNRRAPAREHATVRALASVDDVPSYPSEHAAAAAAAAMILAYAFPLDDSANFARMAREAAESRIVAGAAYRSDVDVGWAIGRAVASRVLDHARQDGSVQEWSGAVPTGSGKWQPTPPRRVQIPFDVLAGSWTPWVLPAGNVYRLNAPPALGSPAFERDLNELRSLSNGARTVEQMDIARYWATDAPSIRWQLFLEDELARRRWSVPHAARARAYVSIAMFDAFIACWDTKYTYWLARPVTVDPPIRTVFSTPPFPSYPSGHSTMSTAAAVVMAELFPDASAAYHEKAEEASFSRVWGGVHFRFDIVDGDSLGARVGRRVVARMREDRARR